MLVPRALGWAVRVCAVGAFGVLVALVVVRWPEGSPGFSSTPEHVVVSPSPNRYDCDSDHEPVVELWLAQLNVSSDTLRVRPTLCLPGEVLRRLRFHGRVLRFRRDRGQLNVPARLKVLMTFTGDQLAIRTVKFTALTPQAPGGLTAGPGPFNLTLGGNGPQSYPLDDYATAVGVNLHWPVGITITGPNGPHDSPGKIVVYASPHLRDTRTVVASNPSPRYVTVEVRRSLSTVVFVFALLTALAALTLSLAIARWQSTEGPRGVEMLVGVAAILVALLPVRSVLVPADISTLTLVDLLLGTLMTALAVLGVWAIPLPGSKPGTPPSRPPP
jgi:hypothetical protein